MIKRKAFAALAVALSVVSGPARAETFADALSAAYNNSGLLEQNRALLRAADEGVAQAVAATLPVINWSISTTRTYTETSQFDATTDTTLARITGDLTLFDFGVNRLGIEAEKEVVLATRQSLRAVEQDVLLRAVEAYMGVRSANQVVQLRQNNVRLLTQELRAAQDRFEVGEITRTDVALAEASLAAARSLMAAAQGELAISIEEYTAAVGVAPSNLAGVSPAPVAQSLAEAKEFALRNHPALLEAQHTVAAADINLTRARAATRPSLNLSGSISNDLDDTTTGQIGLNVGGPIYQGGQILSQFRSVQANADAARSGLHLTAIGVEQAVGNSFALLQVARASLRATEEQVRAAQVAFDGIREEATLGARTTLDVLNAEQELRDAQTARISAQADAVVASYSVLASMGLLTAEHLGLPVQQYDPEAYYDLVKNAPLAVSPQGDALDRVLQALGKE